jgi:hypothetical protein
LLVHASYLLGLILPAYLTPGVRRSLYVRPPCENQFKTVLDGRLPQIVRLWIRIWGGLRAVPPLPFQTGEELEDLLIRVFLRAADPGPVQGRQALTFIIHDPGACLRLDGRDGRTAHLSRGQTAREASSDLTFTMSGQTAHAFWSGELNPVAAITAGQLKLTGPPLRALGLAPGLARVQAVYRLETGGQ